MDPYGFIGKFQGLQGNGKSIGQVAQSLFEIIASHTKTKEVMASALVGQIVSSANPKNALNKLNLLREVETLPAKHLEKIRDNSKDNPALLESKEFVELLNDMLIERDLEKLVKETAVETAFDDDIPF